MCRAWRVIGRPPDRHEWLGYPDGHLAETPRTELVNRIEDILRLETPDVVATFGPDGITGHPDHITVGAATDAAFFQLADGCRPGFSRLLHRVLPQRVFDRWQQQRIALDLPVFDPTQLYHGRAVSDDQIGLTVDCRAVSHKSVAGILEHKSQLHVMLDDPVDLVRLARIMSREWCTVAWPPRAPSAPMLTDVFDQL